MPVDSATQRYEPWLGQWMLLTLACNGGKVGDPSRDVKVGQNDLSLVNIAETKGTGKGRIITVVQSLDTRSANN